MDKISQVEEYRGDDIEFSAEARKNKPAKRLEGVVELLFGMNIAVSTKTS